jgi:hypothetical protein
MYVAPALFLRRQRSFPQCLIVGWKMSIAGEENAAYYNNGGDTGEEYVTEENERSKE